MGWLVTASQSRAVLSSLPVSTVLPSGLKATARTLQSMPDGLADGFPGRRVPPLRRAVAAPGEDGLAVGAERHAQGPNPNVQGRAEGWPVAASQSRAVPSRSR